MTITITPTKLSGTVTPPPSKSQAHRLLIAAALADGESVIDHVAFSQDIEATLRCLEELGAEFTRDGSTVTVRGMGANAMSPLRRMAYPRLDCGESGSTLRFLIPIALAVRGGGIFTGAGRLMERPLAPYFDLFDEKGISYEQKDGVLTVSGLLAPGEYRLPGNVSSQFFTGLLYALPLQDGPSAVIPTTPLESEGYIQMTLRAMAQFGVEMPVTLSLPQYHPQGNQIYHPADAAVEADWSQAGFWYAAKFLGNGVEIAGMDPNSAQGDMVIDALYEEMGLSLAPVGGLELDVSGCPDLVPPLAAMAALRTGETTYLTNAARLRMKESDRLASVTAVLTALGADVAEGPDCLTIRGKERLAGGVTVDSFNDHRIAMMAAVAATRCQRPVTVLEAECVAKSYPDFWEEYERLGGVLEAQGDFDVQSDFDTKARRLLRAMDIFCIVQILSLPVGLACTKLIGFGAGTVLELAQVVASILFLLVFSRQGDNLISTQYPDLEYYKSKSKKGRDDPYTPLLWAAAAGKGDTLTPKLFSRRTPTMLRAFALLLVMASLESFLAR